MQDDRPINVGKSSMEGCSVRLLEGTETTAVNQSGDNLKSWPHSILVRLWEEFGKCFFSGAVPGWV